MLLLQLALHGERFLPRDRVRLDETTRSLSDILLQLGCLRILFGLDFDTAAGHLSQPLIRLTAGCHLGQNRDGPDGRHWGELH